MHTVSIIVPVYNMEKSIKSSVDSLLSQTYDNIEIILVDDGSKDNSLEICRSIAAYDDRIKVFHTENKGSGPARNYGINRSTGKYLYFPDADDFIEPYAISHLVEKMTNSNCDLIVFGFQNVDSEGNILHRQQYENLIYTGEELRNDYSECIGYFNRLAIQGAPWNKFFDGDLIRNHNIYYPALRRHQDEVFIARYMCYANKIRFIDEILYKYETNDLKKEWEKFPVDYIDSVIGLYQSRKETILTWNCNDKKTEHIVKCEHLCKVVKALELTFSPKIKGMKNRKAHIDSILKKTNIYSFEMTDDDRYKYQLTILRLIKNNRLWTLYFVLKLKVNIEMCFPKVIALMKRR